MSICVVYSMVFLLGAFILFFSSMYFIFTGLVYFVEFDIFSLNSSSITFILLLD